MKTPIINIYILCLLFIGMSCIHNYNKNEIENQSLRNLPKSNTRMFSHSTGMNVYTTDQEIMSGVLNDIFSHISLLSNNEIGTFIVESNLEPGSTPEIPKEVWMNSDNYLPIDMVGNNDNFESGHMVLYSSGNLSSYLGQDQTLFYIGWDKISYDELLNTIVMSETNSGRQNDIDSLLTYAENKGYLYIGSLSIPDTKIATVEYFLDYMGESERLSTISSFTQYDPCDENDCEVCKSTMAFCPDGHSRCFEYYLGLPQKAVICKLSKFCDHWGNLIFRYEVNFCSGIDAILSV